LAFFEFVEGEIAAMMERWRVHREQVFGKGQGRPQGGAGRVQPWAEPGQGRPWAEPLSAPSSPPVPSGPAARTAPVSAA
ncbi:hypothetical protein ACKI19_45225, partial [Streptomyces caniscabiei]